MRTDRFTIASRRHSTRLHLLLELTGCLLPPLQELFLIASGSLPLVLALAKDVVFEHAQDLKLCQRRLTVLKVYEQICALEWSLIRFSAIQLRVLL